MARTIPPSLASVVEQLELDTPAVVTIEDLAALVSRDRTTAYVRQLAYELQREGWLGHLRTRNAWEFLPGSRAGAYGSTDRFIEFRAKRAVDPSWSGVLAMESAATLHALAQHVPGQEVLALPDGEVFPKAFVRDWRYVRLDLGPAASTTINGLPVWTVEALLVGIAARPTGYRDVAGLAQWLPDVARLIDVAVIVRLLEPLNDSTRQRAGYLLSAAGGAELATPVMAVYPPSQPVWLGPRVRGGHFDRATMVNDTLLHGYRSIGTGA